MHYSYRGRCVGRVLGALEVYVGLDCAEQACVGNGSIHYRGELFCSVDWPDDPDDDRPFITFLTNSYTDDDRAAYYQRRQYAFRPYLDNPAARSNLAFVIQEVGNYLTMNDGKAVYWLMQKPADEQKRLIQINRIFSIIENNVVGVIRKFGTGLPEGDWFHVACSAVYGVIQSE